MIEKDAKERRNMDDNKPEIIEAPVTEAKPVEVIPVDPQIATAILAQEKIERENRAMQRIVAILEEENCRADAKITILGDSKIHSEVVVSAYDGIPAKKEEVKENAS